MQTDFILHGLADFRRLDASPRDVITVTQKLGPIHPALDREPDIIISKGKPLLNEIGEQCEIVCERGLPVVPLFIPTNRFTGKGLQFHAPSFTYNGTDEPW